MLLLAAPVDAVVTVLEPKVRFATGVVTGAAAFAVKLKGAAAVVFAGATVFTGILNGDAAGVAVLAPCDEVTVVALVTAPN